MANERGLIPEARREELSEELRGMLGRWTATPTRTTTSS